MSTPNRNRVAVLGTIIALGWQGAGWAAAEALCPAPRATCVLPAATRLAVETPAYFHASHVELTPTSTDALCAEPRATCVQPQARVAELVEHALQWNAGRRPRETVDVLLRAWAEASPHRPAWTANEKQWLARRHQPWLSAVALDTVMRIASSVTVADLSREFTWTIDNSRGEASILHAVPTDETQRLFCPQLRVEIDPLTHALTAIDVADRAGTWRPIDLPWAVLTQPLAEQPTIILAAGSAEIDPDDAALPPSPTTVPRLRFAAERLEFDVTTPR